jgi:Caspase domain
MKSIVILGLMLIALCITTRAQKISGKSNPVHVEVSSVVAPTPPVLIWLSPDQATTALNVKKMVIRVGINSTVKLKNVTVLVNGNVPESDRGIGEAQSPEARKFAQFIERELELSAGLNEIKVIAENENGDKAVESRNVNVKLPAALALNERTDYALIIATNDYIEWGDLVNPVFDATAIADELKENYGFKVDFVKNPTKTEVLKKIKEYSTMNYLPDDQLFIFIAGHGKFDDVIKDGYLVSKDSRKADETNESYIPFSYLKTAIDNNPCKHIYLVMDACFGGTFDQAIAKRGEDDEGMYSEVTQTEFIKKKLRFKTRVYLTSGAKEYVPDGKAGKHSPFASKFIEALRAYGGRNKVLTSQQIFLYVERTKPEPRYGTFGDNEPGSEFVFVAR